MKLRTPATTSTFVQFVKATWSVRDYISLKHGNAIRSWSLSDLVNICLTEYFDNKDESEPIHNFFKVGCTKQGKDHTWNNWSRKEVYDVMVENRNKRSFRLVAAADRTAVDEDTRFRDMLLRAMQNNFVFSLYSLLTPFICERDYESKRVNGFYLTSVATRFEQMLFLSMFLFVANNLKSKNPIVNLPNFSLNKECVQRMGWVIQKILRGWDYLAAVLNFQDAEEMFFPFLFLNDSTMSFTVIESKESGYMPISAKRSLSFPLKTTTEKSDMSPYLSKLSDEVDSYLRHITRLFLEDVRTAISDNRLYDVSQPEEYSVVLKYVTEDDNLPPRFSNFPLQTIKESADLLSKIKSPRKTVTIQSSSQSESEHPRKRRRLQLIGPSTFPIVKEENIPCEPQVTPTSMVPPVPDTARNSDNNDGDNSDDVDSFLGDVIEDATDDYKMLELALKSWLEMHCCSFQKILEVHEAMTKHRLSGKVQFLLTDPPYNLRRERGDANAEYDELSSKDMKKVVELTADVLRPGGHGFIFCSFQQLQKWKKLFNHVRDHEGNQVFSVDLAPFLLIRHPNNFTSPISRNGTELLNSSEYAVHVKKNGLLQAEEVKMVNYKGFNHVNSTMQGYRNVIDNIKPLLPGERLMIELNGTSTALRWEQKPLALLKELISRFSQPGDIVMDIFAGTFSTAIACFQLQNPRMFVGCEDDLTCFRVAREHVLRKFASQINRIQQFQVPPNVKEAALRIIATEKPDRTELLWRAPESLPSFPSLPPHLLTSLCNTWKSPLLFPDLKDKPLRQWDSEHQARIEQVYWKDLLDADASCQGLMLTNVTEDINSSNTSRCYASSSFQPGDIVCHYFGTIVYNDISKLGSCKKTYEDGIIGINQDEYKRYGYKLYVYGNRFASINDNQFRKKYITLVPSRFTAARYIRQIQTDGSDNSKSNVAFHELDHHITDPAKLCSYKLLQLRATNTINPGDEVLLKVSRSSIVLD